MASHDSNLSAPGHGNYSLFKNLLSEPPKSRSRALVQVNHSDPDQGLDADDLVLIDFICTKVETDALYVISYGINWVGFRRFRLGIDGEIFIEESGVMRALGQEDLQKISVMGRVIKIYKSIAQSTPGLH